MRLRYKAATKEGKMTRGLIDAKDINEAVVYLRAKNLLPIEITKADSKIFGGLPFMNKVKNSDLVLFTRQLSSMLSSGLTLIRSLDILRDQMQNKAMSEVITTIIADIEEGRTLAVAIAKHPSVFSPIYISIVKAGEQSGLMDKVLLRLADNLEKQAKLKSTIKAALFYPAIVVFLMVVVVVIMMIFVIPQLSLFYKDLNVPLPLITLVVVGASNAFVTFWPIVFGGGALLIYLFKRWVKTPDGRLIYDDILLKLPIFGKIISGTILSEFSRTLGLLIGTGTLVVEALNETAAIAGNVHYQNAIIDVSRQVEKGVTIGDAMAHYTLFPPLLVQLVKTGEQTGKIDETLGKASEYFEREVDQKVKTLTTALEPAIMVVLGIGVAFLVISVLVPIYGGISAIQ